MLFLIVILIAGNTVHAEEMFPGYTVRYGNMKYINGAGLCLDIECYASSSVTNSAWGSKVSYAIDKWRTSTNWKVYSTRIYSYSNSDIYMSGTNWSNLPGGITIMGVTICYDDDGDKYTLSNTSYSYYDLNNSGYNTAFDGIVEYAVIYLNSSSSAATILNNNSGFAEYGILHEMGHVLGMGHNNRESIMNYDEAGATAPFQYDIDLIDQWY